MNIKSAYLSICQKAGAIISAPSSANIQVALFAVGVILLSSGLASGALAQVDIDASEINYNTDRIADATAVILGYIEGTFGALIMVVSGLGAIMSSAFGQYRAALGCLIVAVGAFILRSVVSTFFNMEGIQD